MSLELNNEVLYKDNDDIIDVKFNILNESMLKSVKTFLNDKITKEGFIMDLSDNIWKYKSNDKILYDIFNIINKNNKYILENIECIIYKYGDIDKYKIYSNDINSVTLNYNINIDDINNSKFNLILIENCIKKSILSEIYRIDTEDVFNNIDDSYNIITNTILYYDFIGTLFNYNLFKNYIITFMKEICYINKNNNELLKIYNTTTNFFKNNNYIKIIFNNIYNIKFTNKSVKIQNLEMEDFSICGSIDRIKNKYHKDSIFYMINRFFSKLTRTYNEIMDNRGYCNILIPNNPFPSSIVYYDNMLISYPGYYLSQQSSFRRMMINYNKIIILFHCKKQ